MIKTTFILGAALAAAVGVIALKQAEEGRLRAVIKGHENCARAVDGDRAYDLGGCPAPIFKATTEARDARDCERGLQLLNLGAPASCTTHVRRLAADRDAKASEAVNLTDQLNQANATQAAAVARAIVRERTAATRTNHAETVVASAPRSDRGLVVLDAGRLCELAGCPGQRPDR